MFQSVVIASIQLVIPIRAALLQQVRTEKYVELTCDQALAGFLAPLAFNLILILVCAVLGYLARKLPENFNESWYIFISVTTTLFMWLVFLPTYFSAFYAYHQEALIAFCLILNALITLMCLFVPKLYAIVYLEDHQLKFGILSDGNSSLRSNTVSSIDQPRNPGSAN